MKRIPAILLTLALGLLAIPASTAQAAAVCTAHIGGGCGPYVWAGWPGSNGFNTYVMDQAVDPAPGSTGTVTVTSPSSWSATAHYPSCGGCVQTFDAVQQLTNNWGGGGWNGGSDTPLSALSLLQVRYTESSPSGAGDQYEFSPDIWLNPYAGVRCGGCGDVMLWVDTSAQRCSAVDGWRVLGHPVIAGQDWTAYVAPGGTGEEIILVLDGAGGPGSCARQGSGTIHVLASLRWLSKHPGPSGFPAFSTLTMSQLNTGWEITQGDGATFTVSRMAYRVRLAAGG